MLTVEVRVNGNLVAELQAINTALASNDPGRNFYNYGGSTHPMGAGREPRPFSGTVTYLRDEGILKLVRIILEDLE